MIEKINILIVEDDETASFLLQSFLQDCDFCVDCVYTITDGISYLKNKKYDLLLLDLSLPDFSGFELLSNINNSIVIPTIVISAYSDTNTKVKAFKYGANDYLTKPIDFIELEARIWSLLSRKENINLQDKNKNEILKIDKNQIYFKNQILNLTALEFDILSYFIKHKGEIISRDLLTNSISSVKSHRLLDNHIKNIRKKIEEDSSKPNYLKTEYAVGYKLDY
ncbi:MAG: response regulator transcription factor [Arcobacteraceae bacterium]|nr:response regulator transcription factor [Arcobacteraceae bacterium]